MYRIHLLCFLLFCSTLLCQEYKILAGDNDEPVLVGITDRSIYQDSSFASWFNYEYTNYEVNAKILDKNKGSFEDKIIKVILGTWCSDSKREVPRFVKVLDFVGFPSDKVLFINVNRSKMGLAGEVDGLDIEFVPTFIIYENGNEIGRIIERPLKTLEEDLLSIIN